MGRMKWEPTPVDKDYVAWLDRKEMEKENGTVGKGDDIRPYGKRAFDKNYDKIKWDK